MSGGRLVEGGIGPADRPLETQGSWELEGDDRLVLRPASPAPPRIMKIAFVDENRLVIEK